MARRQRLRTADPAWTLSGRRAAAMRFGSPRRRRASLSWEPLRRVAPLRRRRGLLIAWFSAAPGRSATWTYHVWLAAQTPSCTTPRSSSPPLLSSSTPAAPVRRPVCLLAASYGPSGKFVHLRILGFVQQAGALGVPFQARPDDTSAPVSEYAGRALWLLAGSMGRHGCLVRPRRYESTQIHIHILISQNVVVPPSSPPSTPKEILGFADRLAPPGPDGQS